MAEEGREEQGTRQGNRNSPRQREAGGRGGVETRGAGAGVGGTDARLGQTEVAAGASGLFPRTVLVRALKVLASRAPAQAWAHLGDWSPQQASGARTAGE